jgi:hypothetical protein
MKAKRLAAASGILLLSADTAALKPEPAAGEEASVKAEPSECPICPADGPPPPAKAPTRAHSPPASTRAVRRGRLALDFAVVFIAALYHCLYIPIRDSPHEMALKVHTCGCARMAAPL